MPCAKGHTENENKIIANLQFGDWYHLNTRWLTQKKKFIMPYVSMTIYNIYSFLFIIVYIVCIIICFLRYCIFVLDKKSREINRKNWWFMYNPIWRHTKYGYDNTTTIYFLSTDNVFLPSLLFWNWFWLDAYWNWMSDIIYISFTNKDVVYFCLQNVERTNQIMINFILAL